MIMIYFKPFPNNAFICEPVKTVSVFPESRLEIIVSTGLSHLIWGIDIRALRRDWQEGGHLKRAYMKG